MGNRLLLTLGWLWPFVVATVGVAAVTAGYTLRSGGEVSLQFLATLLGSPAVYATIIKWPPATWMEGPRQAVAVAVTVPVLAIEPVLALCVFAAAANAVGYGWVE